MKKTLIGTLLAATVASAILAAPGGAAKPANAVYCVPGANGTTVTWVSGTTSAQVTWLDGNLATVGEALVTVTTHGPDSTLLNTPANAATARAVYSGKKPSFAIGVCTSA